jgi:hypothetical protein
MEDKDRGISIEDFKAPVQEQEKVVSNQQDMRVVEVPRDENDHPDSEFVAVSLFNLNGRLKVFELDKETVEIKPARIVSKRIKNKLIAMVECKKKTHRYVAARNFVDANKKFVELVTEKKYSEVMRNLKNKSNG